eukprot:2848608-Amphidinium_carterae.1
MVEDGVEVQMGKDGLCPSPDARVKALPGRAEGTVQPRTPRKARGVQNSTYRSSAVRPACLQQQQEPQEKPVAM